MLSRLSVRNIVLIEALDLEFAAGFTVLTGETGAGKSILLDALSLALGAKGDGKLLRKGASEASVSATFEVAPTHPAHALLSEAGRAPEDAIILRRTLAEDGRTRAFVNDQPASVGLLRAIGATLLELHGQHADRALLQVATHRSLVDAFGGLGGSVQHVSALYENWKAAEASLTARKLAVDAARQEADYLRASVEELSALDAEPGEEETLSGARHEMSAAERVAEDLAEAAGVLEGPRSPIPSLAGALRKLERKQGGAEDALGPVMDALAGALDVLEDARATIADARRTLNYDPQRMEELEERLFALRAAARKYKVPADELANLAATMADDLAAIDAGEAEIDALTRALASADAAYHAAAQTLSDARQGAADDLQSSVMDELAPLKLGKARFMVDRQAVPPGPEGIDGLSFVVQTNPSTPAGPMHKIASGGEFSRFLLALKVCLADKGSASTLIFDEIDTGVGGAVSDAIGSRMARLSERVQVISITHAPQVAARADAHLLIAKSEGADSTTATVVRALSDAERREEIARMLAGATITQEARAAAGRLIGA